LHNLCEQVLPNISLPADEGIDVRIRIKWLRKYMAASEEPINISPTINHAHNGVEEGAVGVLIGLGLTTLDRNMTGVCGVIIAHAVLRVEVIEPSASGTLS
jgi:hypothetical protein